MTRHATCVGLWLSGGWRGLLIEGPSGAGKSDLALRLMDRGARLVADDRTLVWASQGRLFARSPATIAGLVEARGLGVLAADPLRMVQVALVVRCAGLEEDVERMPQDDRITVCDISLPRVALRPFEPSTTAKLHKLVASTGQGPQGAYQAPAAMAAREGNPVRSRV